MNDFGKRFLMREMTNEPDNDVTIMVIMRMMITQIQKEGVKEEKKKTDI